MHKTSKEKKNVTQVTFSKPAQEEVNTPVPVEEISTAQQEKKDIPPANTPQSTNWLAWASTSTIFASLAYAAIYLTGLAYYDSYLRVSRIPPDLFPKTPADYLVSGYTAWLELVVKLLTPLFSSPAAWLPVSIIVFLCWGMGYFLFRASESKKMEQVRSSIKSSRNLRFIGGMFFIPVTLVSLVVMVSLMIVTVGILPVLVGQVASNEVAKTDAKAMEHGCAGSHGTKICYDLMEGEKLIARGFVIEASDKYVALRTDSGTEILPLKERSIQSYTPPAPQQSDAPGKAPVDHK